MLQLENSTPFVPGMSVFPDEQGIDTLYLALKATFATAGGKVFVAPEQRPLVLADTFNGEPGRSSLRHASEGHLLKPSTDVVLVGDAFAPRGRPTPSCQVSVSVGPVRKVLQVTGDRTWRTGAGGQRASSPQPFLQMPLVYERAFGGAFQRPGGEVFQETRNPVGCGLRGDRSATEMEGVPLPNLEDPAQLVQAPGDAPAPAGVGFVAPSWDPRRAFAGTYDAAWLATRAPYLPEDFDPRFFQAASTGLVCPRPLRGGEPVDLLNASPEGVERYRLPTCAVQAVVSVEGRLELRPLALETVLLEPGEARVSLLFRAALRCDRRVLRVERARFELQALSGVEGGA